MHLRVDGTKWLLLQLLVQLLLPVAVQAQFLYVTNNGTLTITGYTGAGGAVTIPDTINDLPVINIGAYAFYNKSNLSSVTILGNVSSIGDKAFSRCWEITIAALGNGLINIGNWAFHECASLVDITIPDTVISIGSDVFSHCGRLTNVVIGNGVILIGGSAFSSCTTLTSLEIGNSLTTIGSDAFSSCTKLTEVTAPIAFLKPLP